MWVQRAKLEETRHANQRYPVLLRSKGNHMAARPGQQATIRHHCVRWHDYLVDTRHHRKSGGVVDDSCVNTSEAQIPCHLLTLKQRCRLGNNHLKITLFAGCLEEFGDSCRLAVS